MAGLWYMIIIGVILLATGIKGWLRQHRYGFLSTGLSDTVPWGLYISSFFFLAALGGGLLVLTALLQLWPQPAAAPAALVQSPALALGCFIGAGVLILADLGQPNHTLKTATRWRLASPFTWDALFWVLGTITSILWLILPSAPRLPALGIMVGAGIFTAHGYIFLRSKPHPWWQNGYLILRFALEGVVTAAAAITLLLLVSKVDVDWLLLPLAGLTGGTLVLLGLERAGYQQRAASISPLTWGYLGGIIPTRQELMAAYRPWWENVIFYLLPLILLLKVQFLPAGRLPLMAVASTLVLVGVYLDKETLLVQPQLKPLLKYPAAYRNPLPTYRPEAVEYELTAGALGIALLITGLTVLLVSG